MQLPTWLDEDWLEDWFPTRCVRRFFAVQGFDRAMVIASQAFTALIPLVILTSAILPTENHGSIADAIVRKFALTGDSANAVQTVFAPSGEASIGVLSVVLLLLSGVAAGSGPRRKQRRRSAVLGCSSHCSTRGRWWEVFGRQGGPYSIMRRRIIVDLIKSPAESDEIRS